MNRKNKAESKIYLRDGRSPLPKHEVTSRIMSSIRAKNTTPEIALRKSLMLYDLSGYRLHWKNVPGRPDICYPKKKLAIFVNGCYWHRCPKCKPDFPKSHKRFWQEKFSRNVDRDRKKVRQLRKMGWSVITVWECDIEKRINSVVRRIAKKYAAIKR